jgi:origin recognition complex subunit 3
MQPVYVYAPANVPDDPSTRPAKRRKVGRALTSTSGTAPAQTLKFEPLLNGLENPEYVALRQETFERAWSKTDAQIQVCVLQQRLGPGLTVLQSILDEANEDTFREVTAFVDGMRTAGYISPDRPSGATLLMVIRSPAARVPTGFIVTGPNISSHSLLFKQLSARLKTEINGPIVVLRSSDASNLKGVLKHLIRDATNQRPGDDDEEGLSAEQDVCNHSISQRSALTLQGWKLLNYDLEILHAYVKAHGSQSVVIAFQDSEAFDSSLISELVNLFRLVESCPSKL